MDQQAEVAAFGMWNFLATEVRLFGIMLFSYTAYRGVYPEGFAEAGRHTRIVIGTVNTVILLPGSFVVASTVHPAERDRGPAPRRSHRERDACSSTRKRNSAGWPCFLLRGSGNRHLKGCAMA
ncbi:hypothetical protein [Skermanella pratensis]|uniref:hypothetical protein n=1 Tax=Skermanella pratensis TaxID=2233999 RepID=UPI0013011594|nr:hypothetical protein [Skermanella pratensis]